MSDNPYSSPTVAGTEVDPSKVPLGSVTRVYKWLGWVGAIIYVPIVITCVAALALSLAGHHEESPLVLAFASLVNGAILTLAVLLLLTSRRIAARDYSVRGRALILSCILMLGFPLLTVVGIICYRNITQHFLNAESDTTPRPTT